MTLVFFQGGFPRTLHCHEAAHPRKGFHPHLASSSLDQLLADPSPFHLLLGSPFHPGWSSHLVAVSFWLAGAKAFFVSPASRIEKDGGFHLSRFGDPHHRAARSLQKLMPTPAEPAPGPMLRSIPWQAHRVQVFLKIGNIYGKLRILIERQRLFFKSQWWAISHFCICGKVCTALRGAASLIPIWIRQVKTYIWSANIHIQWDGNDRGQTESKMG